jgi:tRNA threonylcarbamoyl adenosine modification protein YeaZ
VGRVLVLAFDTSTPAVTVAAATGWPDAVHAPASGSGGEIVATFTEVATNRHGELLAPLIARTLAAAGATPPDVGAIAVGLGPGPFTGLRVGVVTAGTMADALGVPAYGACSLDIVAERHRGGEPVVAVVNDARRRQVYWAAYDAAGGRVAGPHIGWPAEVASALAGRVTHLAGAGAAMYADAFADFVVVDHDRYPDATDLIRVVGRASRNPAGDDLAPMYLRRPDAARPGPPKRVTP